MGYRGKTEGADPFSHYFNLKLPFNFSFLSINNNQPQQPQISTPPSSIPSALIMNSIAQLAARSARLNGASALRQANPIARRAFTNGTIHQSFSFILPSSTKQNNS
jgi:hypothetical protein